MNMASGTRPQRMLLAVILAIFALYCDKASLGASRGHFQEALWTVSVVALFLIELRRTLTRARPIVLALFLLCLHVYIMYLKRDAFPFDSSLVMLLCALLESVLLGFVYVRLCQSIDPSGPFGLTEAEKQARKKTVVRLG